jgi:hypothetical protein
MNARMTWLAGMSLLGACYSYQAAGPVDTVSPKTGTRIALTLTEEGVAVLAGHLGPQSTYIEGDLLEADSTGLRLAVRRVEDWRHMGTEWKGEQVTIPRAAIASVSERRLSIGATAIVSGLALGGVLGTYAAFGTDGGADGVAIPPQGPRQ